MSLKASSEWLPCEEFLLPESSYEEPFETEPRKLRESFLTRWTQWLTVVGVIALVAVGIFIIFIASSVQNTKLLVANR